MAQHTQLPGLWKALAQKELGLTTALAQIEIRLTNTPHNPAWEKVTDSGFVAAIVPNFFADELLVVTSSGNNIGGDGYQDTAIGNKDFVSAGSVTGPYQYIYFVDGINDWLLSYGDHGSPQLIGVGEALEVRTDDASNRIFSIGS